MSYGSLTNLIIADRCKYPAPTVGMGVTECCWTDRHAWEVVEVRKPTECVIRRMKAERTTPWPGNGWNLSSDPDGERATIRQSKGGKWYAVVNGRMDKRGSGYAIGTADEYEDPSF